ncbi:MAG TPA: hypothetical protein V6C89_12250 [Drouetiella sp.]|jgi:hypothetical protein
MTAAEMTESAMQDALTHLFAEDREIQTVVSEGEQQQEKEIDQTQSASAVSTVAAENISIGEGHDLPAPIPNQSDSGKPKVSRAELIQIMEGFVELVKNSDEADGSNQLSFAPPQIEVRDVVSAADQAAEIAELKTLLVEAQGTIIRLLTDRVDDRARLATLQNEIKLLPDLKAQSERAAAIAFTAEEFKAEFAKVKLEIERMKLTKMRSEVDNASRPWWAKFFAWMKKKDSAQD